MKKPTPELTTTWRDIVRTILPHCSQSDLSMIRSLLTDSIAALSPTAPPDPRLPALQEALTMVTSHARSTGFSLPEAVPA